MNNIEQSLTSAIAKAVNDVYGMEPEAGLVMVEIPKDTANGDYSTNIAMRLPKLVHKAPQEIAKAIVEKLEQSLDNVETIEIAGPGFINFRMKKTAISSIINTVLEKCPDEIDFFNSFVDKGLKERLEHVASSDFARVTYTEAVKILEENNDKFDFKVYWGCDLQTEHERYLTEQVYKRPVFVTDYPKEIKAFYMRQNDDGKTVAAADCLVPGIGELIGGSQREERLEVLEARIKELGMDPEDYWWYCDLRKYGTCRHAGYGMGFERMVMYLTGVNNIRDVELHPRTWGNADF